MKTLKFKSSIVVAAILVFSSFTATSVFAQRGGRGGGGGGGRSSSFHGPSRGSFGSVRTSASIGFRGHYGYRPGGWGYRRPFYPYRSYYRPYIGFSIGILPFGYYPFFYGADQFYYAGGLFYRQYDDEYKVVVPPLGAEVPTIPSDAQEVVINGQTYYEYKGVYYSPVKNADNKTVYVVAGKDGVLNTDGNNDANVDNGPQIGDIVSQLPEGYKEVMVKGNKYYVSDYGVYYEQIFDDAGKVVYKVIGK
ncbi:DUF6515 family protein [Pedobacter cryoconitis]|uniref:Uncharacterized protein n=1 Tax=Pedobacter cryoconitis TaxID=188932 RepID=A0A7X0MM28_9SPHI|nr:DUF6515 family protein [Pedobacter cryoconitis]MBB6502505.1 hypothetical protein [Pedobacter cryoconitis]